MIKRFFDILVAVSLLALLCLPMVLIAIWVRLDSPGPSLYRQERVGRNGLTFRIRKFRTMRHLPDQGLPLTVPDDPRVSRAGHWLRARRLDELPQLIDVLQGRMSLVGPRPEVPRYVAHYPAHLHEIIFSVRPGITDPAALEFRDEAQLLAPATDPEQHYLHEVLPRKLQLQAHYIQHATFFTDLRVLLKTAAVLYTR